MIRPNLKDEIIGGSARGQKFWLIQGLNRRDIFIGLCVLFILILCWFGYQFAVSPSEAVINQPITILDEANIQEEPVKKLATIQGRYFTLDYENTFNTLSDISLQDPNALEAYRLTQSDGAMITNVVVNIKKLPPGGLGEDSNYHMRLVRPAEYTQSKETFGRNAVTFMQKIDQTELVGFMVNGDKLATLALTSTRPSGMEGAAKNLLRYFQWLN